METLSLTRFRSNMSAALSRVDSGQDVRIKSRKRTYKIVPIDEEESNNAITPELEEKICKAREELRGGNCTTCHNIDELNTFLDSL